MAGHSKWHSIKHKKAATDKKRGKVLTKHAKILAVIGRNDPNPDTNASLRVAIANAKADSVPKDNIERILKKIAGEGKDGVVYSQQVFEGYGPDGIPFIVLALTENNNRTFPNVRLAFTKNGGTLGSQGSVGFMFDHLGVIRIKTDGRTEEELFEAVMNANGQDFTYDTEESEVVTAFKNLGAVRDALSAQNIEVLKAELEYRPKDPKIITDKATYEKLERFTEAIENVDDVDEVYHGFIPDDSLIS